MSKGEVGRPRAGQPPGHPRRYDVAVVGLGPVGGVLAALLSQLGVDTIVIEPELVAAPHPRAIAADDEMLRTMLRLPGLADPIRLFDAGQRVEVRDARNRLLTTISFDESALGVPGLSFFHQPTLERELRATAARLPHVELALGRRLTGLRDQRTGVALELDDGSTLEAAFVVGCDGAASTVRRLRNIGYGGRTFAEPWIVVDVDSLEPLAHLPYFTYRLDPRRPAVDMPRPGGHRFEFMVLAGEDPAALLDKQNLATWLAPYLEPLDSAARSRLRVVRAVVYTFHARTASRFRDGRVLLAGDAAHSMPPFAGQGLGAGVGDALALAWRLSEVCRGLASPASLDEYERERRPRVAEMTRTALIAGRLLTSTNAAGAAAIRTGLRTVDAAPVLGSRFRAGVLRAPARVPVPAGERRLGGGRPLPNSRIRTRDGRVLRLDDVLPAGWAVIGRDSNPWQVLPSPLAAALRERGCTAVAATAPGAFIPVADALQLEDLDGSLLALWRRRTRDVAVLVRPDRFLAGVGPGQYLAEVFDRLCPPGHTAAARGVGLTSKR